MVRHLWSIPAMRMARTPLTITITLRPAASVAGPESPGGSSTWRRMSAETRRVGGQTGSRVTYPACLTDGKLEGDGDEGSHAARGDLGDRARSAARTVIESGGRRFMHGLRRPLSRLRREPKRHRLGA